MDVNIQSLKFDASKQLIEFVEKKMARLERFADRPTGVDVVLKLEKDDEKGNKVAQVTLHVPGGDILTEQHAHTFEEAVACGTAAVISPIERIDDLEMKRSYVISKDGKPGPICRKLYDTLRGIQYGDIEDRHGWVTVVE